MGNPRKPVSGRTRALVIALDKGVVWLSRHWLALFNVLAGLYMGLPILAPLLLALNVELPAKVIYFVYGFLCHQQPQRSFLLVDHQIAFCQRDLAIYVTVFLAGVAYAASERRWRPLSWWGAILMVSPAVIDGSTQMFAAYESTWYLRLVTGILTGAGAVWFLYPRVDRAFGQVQRQAIQQLDRAARRERNLPREHRSEREK